MSESIHNEIRTFLIDPSQKGQQARDEALFALSAAKIVAVTLSSFALLSGVLAINVLTQGRVISGSVLVLLTAGITVGAKDTYTIADNATNIITSVFSRAKACCSSDGLTRELLKNTLTESLLKDPLSVIFRNDLS